jgi:hypothetical protein
MSYILSMDGMTENKSRMTVLHDAAQLHALLEAAACADLDVGTGITEEYAEELTASIRAGRR